MQRSSGRRGGCEQLDQIEESENPNSGEKDLNFREKSLGQFIKVLRILLHYSMRQSTGIITMPC